MATDLDSGSERNDPARVLPFRPRPSSVRAQEPAPEPIEPDDFRHRMIVNAAAVIFTLVLIGCGIWLANSIADLRRTSDCALAGLRNCAHP